jgi:hypothetical protein
MKINVFVKSLLISVAFLPVIAKGQNLVENGDAEAGKKNWSGISSISKDSPQSGEACFEMDISAYAIASGFIPVDGVKSYIISGYFKNPGTAPIKKVYLSLMPFDADKKKISPWEVKISPPPTGGSETVLAEACKESDTVIKIKDGSKWKAEPFGCIAFNVDTTSNLSDLPNRNCSALGIKSVEKKEDHWVVTLAKACGKSYPAGTAVREHQSGSTYIYPNGCIIELSPADGWKKIEGKISGMSTSGTSGDKFWAKTAFVQVSIFTSPVDPTASEKLLFDDIRFEEAK